MRKIKFRAIHKLTKHWFEDIHIIYQDGEWLEDYRALEDGRPMNLEQVAVMQYTGLKDKNGVEIYEEDIIAQHIKNDEYMNIKEVKFGYFEDSVDYFNYDGVGFYAVGNDGEENGELPCMIEIADYEVIGNIYENPELLGDSQ